MRRAGAAILWSVAVSALIVTGTGCGGSRPDANADVVEDPDAGQSAPDTQTPDRPDVAEDPFSWRTQVQDVFFDYDKYNLRQEARELLQANARVLKEHPDARFVLEGHCDERGTNEYNLALGQRRADAVMAYLNDLGVPAGQMSTISYGEERPFDTRSNEAGWARNRRVSFQFR